MERGGTRPRGRVGDVVWVAAVGALSGARTMAAPVLVCDRVRDAVLVAGAPARGLASPRVGVVVHAGAALEMIADKLPFTGDRTAPAGILARTIAGAFAGAVLWSIHRRGWLAGTVLGGAGAIAGAHATWHLRRAIGRGLGATDRSL
ncbi:MAG TPA: hypothetical protein VFG69_17020 [Nannocystaceae bacterium]|nr:hypothetical protein [Nannocystaceae bacterium]